MAVAEVVLGGVRIVPGDLLLLPTDRAHRDPTAFADPGLADPTRKGAALLAFGGGAHICQGPILGTLTAEAMVQAVLDRFTLRPAADRGVLLDHEDWRSFCRLPLHLVRRDDLVMAVPPRMPMGRGIPGSCPCRDPGVPTQDNHQKGSGTG